MRDRPKPKSPQASSVGSGSNLLRVTVQVGDRRFDEDLAEQAVIAPNIEAIDEGLASNPGRYAEWAMLAVEAQKEYDAIKGNIAVVDVDIKDVEARIYLEITDASVPPGGKAPTIPTIQALVQVDPRRLALVRRKQELEAALLTAKGTFDTLKVGKETIGEQKKDSLLELARNLRQEAQTQLSVRADQFKPGGR